MTMLSTMARPAITLEAIPLAERIIARQLYAYARRSGHTRRSARSTVVVHLYPNTLRTLPPRREW